MNRTTTLLTSLLVVSLVLAGCSGTKTTTSSSTAKETTILKTTTVTSTGPGTTMVQTQTVTTTETSTPSASSSSSSPSTGPSGPNPNGDPADTQPPTISGLTVTSSLQNTITATWSAADPDGDIAPVVKSQLQWSLDTSPNTWNSRPFISDRGTKTDSITGLDSCTPLHLRVHAVDNAQTPHETTSASLAAQTNAGPTLTVTGVTFSNVLDDKITVTWSTTGPDDMSSFIMYGTTASYGAISTTAVGTGLHAVTLQSLSPNTSYNLNVRAANHCATANTVNSGNSVQQTAQLVNIDILGNSGPLSFAPAGQSVSGPISVPAGLPIVFQIKNKDSIVHSWEIVGKNYGSGDIAAGATVKVPSSIILTASGSSPYDIRCTHHTTMTGKINAS